VKSVRQFFRRVRQVAALYSVEVCAIWQWQRILQSYTGSRCWCGSPPKSNHLCVAPSLNFPGNFSQSRTDLFVLSC